MLKKLETWQRPLPNNPVVVENIGMDNKTLFEKINELVDFINKLYEIISTQNNQIAKLEQEVRELGGFKLIGDK